MKRRICVVLSLCVVCLILFSSCKREEKGSAKPVVAGFTCGVNITYRALKLNGELTRNADGKLLMTFSEPRSLSGIAISWDGENMAMELGGLSVRVDEAKVPQGALIKSMLRVLTAQPTDGTVTEEGYVMTGEVEGKAYTLVCEPDTGFLRSLSVPEDELSVTFIDAAPLV